MSAASASHAHFTEDARLYARQESTVLSPHSYRSYSLLQNTGYHNVFTANFPGVCFVFVFLDERFSVKVIVKRHGWINCAASGK